MSSAGNVTHWLAQLKEGDAAAAQQLWEHYFQRLVQQAQRKLRGRAADAEDVALSAFASFCRSTEQGRFPRLEDRQDLWQLLLMLTARKAGHLRSLEGRHKRGGGRVQNEAALAGADQEEPALAQVIGREPTTAFAAQVAEEYQRLLDSLGDAELRSIAIWKMEGYTNQEIADKVGRNVRTIERRLTLIRKSWSREDTP